MYTDYSEIENNDGRFYCLFSPRSNLRTSAGHFKDGACQGIEHQLQFVCFRLKKCSVRRWKKKKKTVSAQGFVRGEARQSTQRRKGSVQATVGLSGPPSVFKWVLTLQQICSWILVAQGQESVPTKIIAENRVAAMTPWVLNMHFYIFMCNLGWKWTRNCQAHTKRK